MNRLLGLVATCFTALTLAFTISGCGSMPAAKKDNMSGDKMEGDKMKMEKMEKENGKMEPKMDSKVDKMSTDKDKMEKK